MPSFLCLFPRSPAASDSENNDDSESEPTSRIRQIYSWFKIALKFGGIATEAFPVAKAPVLALIEILKIVDETADNKERHADINKWLSRLEIQFEEPIPGGDRREKERRGQLQRRLGEITQELGRLHEQGLLMRLANSADDNARLEDYVNQIRIAIADYQLQVQRQDHVYLKELADAQRLDKLSYSSLAMYEKAIESRTRCFRDTRAEVLGRLKLWISDPEDHRIFWLNGMAGTGKTTISISLAEYTREKGVFRAGFFCSRDFDETRDIKRIFPSIAYQLALGIPEYGEELIDVLVKPLASSGALETQLRTLIVEPMNKASISIERPGPHVVIIDALDECTDNELFSSPILGALLEHFEAFRRLGLKFFVTSRPVSGIVSTFNRVDISSYRDILYLHDMNPTTVDRDIRAYVTYTLQVMARNRQGHVLPSFPDDEAVESIVKASGQLFIFAATICKFIADSSYQSPAHIMHQFTTTSPTTPHGERIIRFEELGRLYQLVFKDAFRGEADRNNLRAKSRLRLVIAAIVLVFTPLPKDDLAELLGSEYTPSVIQMLLTHMHSVIHVPEDDTRPIRPLHASFGDHITTKREITTPDDIDDYFYVHPPTYHAYLADFCFRVMENHLVRANICGLPRNEDYVAISNLAECRKRTLTRALEYACCHWGDHLVAALNVGETLAGGEERIQTVIGGARKFATVRLLRWIDVLSVIQELDKAAPMLTKARESLTRHLTSDDPLLVLLADAERLVFDFYDTLRDSALQVYISALPFTPKKTLIYQNFYNDISGEANVISGVGDEWDFRLRSIHAKQSVSCIAISWDSAVLACGTADGGLTLWDLSTGGVRSTLDNHSTKVLSVAFTSEHGLLQSGSEDGVIRVWEINRGSFQERELGRKCSLVAFSSLGDRVATVDDNNHTLRLEKLFRRDTSSDATVSPTRPTALGFHPLIVPHNARSESGISISASKRSTSHSDAAISCLAIAPNGSDVAVGTTECSVMIYSFDRPTIRTPFQSSHSSRGITSIAWSPEGDTIACSFSGRPYVYIFRVQDGVVVFRLCPEEGSKWRSRTYPNIGYAVSVAYSAKGNQIVIGHASTNLITDCDDPTIRLWDISDGIGTLQEVFEGHHSSVNLLAYSCDDRRFVSYQGNTINIWDAENAALGKRVTFRPPPSHISGSRIKSVAFSPDGKRVASTGFDHQTLIWNASSGALLPPLPQKGDPPRCWGLALAFSPDGTLLLSGNQDGTASMYKTSTDHLGEAYYEEHDVVKFRPSSEWGRHTGDHIMKDAGGVYSVCFSWNGAHFALGMQSGWAAVYETDPTHTSEQSPQHVFRHPGHTEVAAVGCGNTFAACWATDQAITICCFSPGAGIKPVQFPTFKTSFWVHDLAFSLDESYLVVSSDQGFLLVFDVNNQNQLQRIDVKGPSGIINLLRFSQDGSKLRSNSGTFDLSEKPDILTWSNDQDGVDGTHWNRYRWIRERAHNRRVCRIPQSFVSWRFAAYENKVVLGTDMGRVVIVHLKHHFDP